MNLWRRREVSLKDINNKDENGYSTDIPRSSECAKKRLILLKFSPSLFCIYMS